MLTSLSLVSIWLRIPILIRAVLTGTFMASLGTVPWSLLAAANLRWLPSVPWAVVVMGFYLPLYWKYTRGQGWPKVTSASRAKNCRARDVSADVWASAIAAGLLGLWALIMFQGVYSRLVRLPSSNAVSELSGVPPVTLVLSLIMAAIVAGVVEESSFRGHMQAPLERRFGPVIAILTTGLVFGFAHFTHKEVNVTLLPWYLGVAAVYGTLAYLTNSILPGLVLHAGGNMFNALSVFATGRTEWQTLQTSPPLVWEAGADTMFWLSLLGFVVVAGLAVMAYLSLARAARVVVPD